MLYLPLAGLFINPQALFITGVCVGMTGVIIGSCAQLMLVPVLNLFGLPAALAVSTGVTRDFSRSAVSLFERAQFKNAHRRLALLLSLFGLAGAAGGCLIMVLLSGINAAAPVMNAIYTLLLLMAVFLLLLTRFGKRDWPGTLFPRLSPPRTELNTIRFSWRDAAWQGLLTGFLSGFLGLGGTWTGKAMLARYLGAPVPVARDTARLSGLIISTGALFAWALSGRLEVIASLILIAGLIIGRSTCSLWTESITRSLFPRLACAAMMVLAAASLPAKQAGAGETAGIITLGGIVLCCALMLICFSGYGLFKRIRPERIKTAAAHQHR
ncbi:sulfite exporter TauE/SafE family protein [Desulfotomaculum copahuensis]|uniref:Probable membrane transporter protein n=1 Tax=Desulfotomaculum copahuensis TaxID=1838280 RepID=A0A1B7LHR4_9FIRM|nr:sulfite exporter TauE/SafE family protein [Desulfotomaculum copahuensis]OAT85846.1 hypothetical protein A6M21_05045 [Desulfotomaculum copahuensis]